jgi:hypothetical protein
LAPGGSQWDYPTVAGGPNGFIATGTSGAVWSSTDGSSWQRLAAANAFGPSRWQLPGQSEAENEDGIPVQLGWSGIAAGPAGYVAAGTDGLCLLTCPSEEAVIWTSVDGRSWTRLPNGPLFTGSPDTESGAGASSIVAWGDRFAAGGIVDGRPAIWISNATPPANEDLPPAPTEIPTPAPTPIATAEPSAEPTAPPPSVAPAVADLLNGFIAARIAGDSIDPYLDLEEGTADDWPLLYTTTSGDRYERGEFEPTVGI